MTDQQRSLFRLLSSLQARGWELHDKGVTPDMIPPGMPAQVTLSPLGEWTSVELVQDRIDAMACPQALAEFNLYHPEVAETMPNFVQWERMGKLYCLSFDARGGRKIIFLAPSVEGWDGAWYVATVANA